MAEVREVMVMAVLVKGAAGKMAGIKVEVVLG